jgi:hypothetical protein
MAPKVAAPAVIGTQTRSASKAQQTPDGSKAVHLGKSNARANVSSKADLPPSSSKAAQDQGIAKRNTSDAKVPITVAKKSSSNANPKVFNEVPKGGSVKTAPKAAKSPPFSPIQPVQLERVGSKQAAATLKTKSANAPTISDSNYSSFYTMLAVKVPSFQRFGERWNSIGESMTGSSVVQGYDPRTFVTDFVRDLSTPANTLDRPTAVLIFKALVDYIKDDPEISFNKRAEWVHGFCDFSGTQVPPPYDDETVRRYARENSQDVQGKRRRINVIPQNDVESLSQESEQSDVDDSNQDDHSFDEAVLNANTVWGVAAGFAVAQRQDSTRQ